jgi:uncharacterized protein YbjT (DUF2867 family)
MTNQHTPLILLTGGTGTTGRRIAERLRARRIAVRVASRSGTPPFDWDRSETWPALLDGATAAYIAYSPDLAMPGAVDIIDRFARAAVDAGVEHLVLLSGRGEDEARAAEQVVRDSGAQWTIVRSSWFAQNFSEGTLLESTRSGTIAMPAGDVAEPFVDVEDIADVATAALADSGHDGRVYEVTGPRLLTFADAASELAAASGRSVTYLDVSPAEFIAGAVADGVPIEVAGWIATLCETVLDGRNEHLGHGVQEALGRAPRDFRDFAVRAASEGAWTPADAAGAR